MNDFRKQMHLAHKKKLCNIIAQFTEYFLEDIDSFVVNPDHFITDWVNKNCLPMGDFSKEDAIKEINGWQSE